MTLEQKNYSTMETTPDDRMPKLTATALLTTGCTCWNIRRWIDNQYPHEEGWTVAAARPAPSFRWSEPSALPLSVMYTLLTLNELRF